MGVSKERFELGNKFERFLEEHSNLPIEKLQEKLNEFVMQHNADMEKINKKLGGGIGEFIRRAERLIERGNYKGSLQVCKKILDAHPTCEEALLMKAECLFHLEKLEDSLDCLKTLLKTNPHSDQAHTQVAATMFAIGDYTAALKAVNNSLKIYSNNFDSVMLKAQILYQLRNPSYKKWIEKARKIDPKRAKNFMNNFWDEEVFDFHSMITLSNSLSEITECMDKKEFKKALDILDRLINLELKKGMKEVVYSMKIECLICLKDYEHAEKLIQKLIMLNKDYPMAYFHRVVIKFNTFYYDEALKELDKCIQVAEKVDMRHPQYYYLKAELLKKFNDKDYTKFEKIAKELEKENVQRFKSFSKESGVSPKDFKKQFGIK